MPAGARGSSSLLASSSSQRGAWLGWPRAPRGHSQKGLAITPALRGREQGREGTQRSSLPGGSTPAPRARGPLPQQPGETYQRRRSLAQPRGHGDGLERLLPRSARAAQRAPCPRSGSGRQRGPWRGRASAQGWGRSPVRSHLVSRFFRSAVGSCNCFTGLSHETQAWRHQTAICNPVITFKCLLLRRASVLGKKLNF